MTNPLAVQTSAITKEDVRADVEHACLPSWDVVRCKKKVLRHGIPSVGFGNDGTGDRATLVPVYTIKETREAHQVFARPSVPGMEHQDRQVARRWTVLVLSPTRKLSGLRDWPCGLACRRRFQHHRQPGGFVSHLQPVDGEEGGWRISTQSRWRWDPTANASDAATGGCPAHGTRVAPKEASWMGVDRWIVFYVQILG